VLAIALRLSLIAKVYADYRENAPSLVSVRNKLPRSHTAQCESAACYHYRGGVGFSGLLMAQQRRWRED
jgi:hypothetical protein